MAKGFQWYPGQRAAVSAKFQRAIADTAEDVLRDVRDEGYVPRVESARPGKVAGMLEDSGKVDVSTLRRGVARIVFDAPHASRNYFAPRKTKFTTKVNAKARSRWFAPYQTGGEKSGFAAERFALRLRGRLGR